MTNEVLWFVHRRQSVGIRLERDLVRPRHVGVVGPAQEPALIDRGVHDLLRVWLSTHAVVRAVWPCCPEAVCLSFVPKGPKVCSCYWSWSSGGGSIAVVLHVVRGSHGSIDVEAFSRGFVAIGLRVGVRLGGVEAHAPLLRQLLPQHGESVASGTQASWPAYLWKAWAFSHRASLLLCHYVAWRSQWLFQSRVSTRKDCPSQGCRGIIHTEWKHPPSGKQAVRQ